MPFLLLNTLSQLTQSGSKITLFSQPAVTELPDADVWNSVLVLVEVWSKYKWMNRFEALDSHLIIIDGAPRKL